MEIIFSDLDRYFGHYRRYNKSFFKKFAKENNLEIIKLKYFDSVGFLFSLFLKILRLDKIENFNSKNLKFYDNYLLKINFIYDIFFNNLFGKNIYFAAKKIIII